jgi:predicted deacylase
VSGREPFRVGSIEVARGVRKDVRLKVSEQTHSGPLHIPVTVIHGARAGPALFVTSTIHGDELNGIEVVRRLRQIVDPARLAGTLALVAIANPVSFILQQRGLPDGRDLNRCFPGRRRGSIGSAIAYDLFRKVISRCTAGIDLHTAGRGRSNLPHLRADLRDRGVRRLAMDTGSAVILDMRGERGSLRREAARAGIPVVTFEAGEAMRFEPHAIEAAVEAVLHVLSSRRMIPPIRKARRRPAVFRRHHWVRARKGGILIMNVAAGDVVPKSKPLGFTSRPLGSLRVEIQAPFEGLVLSTATNPTVLPGSAVCHLASLDGEKAARVRKYVRGIGRGRVAPQGFSRLG